MNDKHDKLVEMALKSGAVNHFVQGLPDRYAFSLGELAAFRSAILADAAKDVEPVAMVVVHDAEPAEFFCAPAFTDLPAGEHDLYRASTLAAAQALNEELRLVLAQRVPPGCVVVPVERLTVEEIKALRQQVRNDPRCQDEHWFVLMARAIEDRYLAAALTDQSQKRESP